MDQLIAPFPSFSGRISRQEAFGGLYYYGARFYDPAVGRFITQDSNSGTGSDPQSMNRYAYARDNPMKYTDPTGNKIATMSSSGITVVPVISAATTAATIAAALGTALALMKAQAAAMAGALQQYRAIQYAIQMQKELMSAYQGMMNQKFAPSQLASVNPSSYGTYAYAGNEFSQPSSTTQTTPTSEVLDCFAHQCGATLVTGIMVDVSVVLTIATLASIQVDLFTGGLLIPGTLALGAVTAASWDSTVEMATYDYQYGSNATPQGALEHGGSGLLAIVQWIAEHWP